MVSNVDNSENVKLPLYKPTVESTYGFLGDEGKKKYEERNGHSHSPFKELDQKNLY